MMDGIRLQDRIYFGMGKAARRIGLPYIVYRPQSALNPIVPQNRVIKIYASFNSEDASYRRVSAFGSAVWWGVFDASYTQPGDYLVNAEATFFVSGQRRALPVQCVRTNRSIWVTRTPAPSQFGYAGQIDAANTPILQGWPASVVELGSRSGSSVEGRFGSWVVLLPNMPVRPEVGDVLTDDLGMRYIIGSAELSDLGWRLQARQVLS